MNSEVKKFSQWAEDLEIKGASEQVSSALQIDIEWARFFACGKYKHIQRITSLLNFADTINTQSNALQKATGNVHKASILDAVTWSLRSNCQAHPLVNAYCEYIAKYGTLKPKAKKLLHEILKNTSKT